MASLLVSAGHITREKTAPADAEAVSRAVY
jgi:hypothetical protein